MLNFKEKNGHYKGVRVQNIFHLIPFYIMYTDLQFISNICSGHQIICSHDQNVVTLDVNAAKDLLHSSGYNYLDVR